jgi:hypothetical protein
LLAPALHLVNFLLLYGIDTLDEFQMIPMYSMEPPAFLDQLMRTSQITAHPSRRLKRFPIEQLRLDS